MATAYKSVMPADAGISSVQAPEGADAATVIKLPERGQGASPQAAARFFIGTGRW